MSGPADPALLRRLAALKAQAALAKLAAARRLAAREAARIARTDAAMTETYGEPSDGCGWQAQWRLRAALEDVRDIQAGARAQREAVAQAHEADAKAAMVRELGVRALEARQAALRRRDEARRLDRVTGVLTALRKPGGPG